MSAQSFSIPKYRLQTPTRTKSTDTLLPHGLSGPFVYILPMINFPPLQGETAQHAHNPIAWEPQLGQECLTHTFRKFRFSITSLELISCRFGHYLHIPICGSPTRAKISLLHSLTYSNRPYDILRHRIPPIFTRLPQSTSCKYMQKNEGPKITFLISEIFTLLWTPTGTPIHHPTQGSDENTGKYFIAL